MPQRNTQPLTYKSSRVAHRPASQTILQPKRPLRSCEQRLRKISQAISPPKSPRPAIPIL
ncbi:hypothetical protein LB505_010896 [Fusarium chuoi]|nr:hypothetical protein LB505_010896 [Fusarium chuoi]